MRGNLLLGCRPFNSRGILESAGALLAGAQELAPELLRVLGARLERPEVGQRGEVFEPEELLEERRGAVEDRAELAAPLLLDQAALLERRDRGVGVDAADACDLRARDGLKVGGDREALGLRLRERRRAWLAEQVPDREVGLGIGRERVPARDLAKDDPELALAEPLAELRERL